MAKPAKTTDPLDMLPDVSLQAIAQANRVSTYGVETTATRIGVSLKRSPTGRKAATPHDAVRIIEALREQARG